MARRRLTYFGLQPVLGAQRRPNAPRECFRQYGDQANAQCRLRRKCVRIASLQARTDNDTAIESKTSRLRQLDPWLDPDADDHDVGVDPLAPLQQDLLVFNPSDPGAEVKTHPLLDVSLQNQIGELSPKHLFKRMVVRCDDIDGKAAP